MKTELPQRIPGDHLGELGAHEEGKSEFDVVAKVGGKIFAFFGEGHSVGLRCGRVRAEADERVFADLARASVQPPSVEVMRRVIAALKGCGPEPMTPPRQRPPTE